MDTDPLSRSITDAVASPLRELARAALGGAALFAELAGQADAQTAELVVLAPGSEDWLESIRTAEQCRGGAAALEATAAAILTSLPEAAEPAAPAAP